MSRPTLSVTLCNYNHGRYLLKCFGGLLRQTWTDFEILVTDDGSTDGSQQIIAEFAAKDQRFKPVYLPVNRGAMAAAAQTIERAQGELIFGHAADDFIVEATFFERAVTSLQEHPQAAGFFAVTGLLSDERNVVYATMGTAPQEGFISPGEFFSGFIRNKIFVPGASSIWRHERLKEVGGYDYALGPQIDFLVNHLLPTKHGVVFSRTPMTCQRTFDDGSNYGSKGGTLWDATTRYQKIELVLRGEGIPYPGMETDWTRWRAHWMIDAIKTTGVRLAP